MRIAVLDDYQGIALEMADWSVLGSDTEITVFTDTIADPQAVIDRLMPFDVICAMRERTPLLADTINALPNLKLIVTSGMRNQSIDISAAAAREIPVCGTAVPGHATAELAFALILNLARNLTANINSMADTGWQVGLGRDLRGATLGIIGLGKLGKQLAAIGATFGMNIVAWSENLSEVRATEAGALRVGKEQLFTDADFITVHTLLSNRTRGLIGAPEIALMKPDASLVNTSRAPIIDIAALTEALREGRIAGAALDVHDVEPLPAGSDLRNVPNLILTPHIGYVTHETMEIFYRETVEDVRAWMDGAPVRALGG